MEDLKTFEVLYTGSFTITIEVEAESEEEAIELTREDAYVAAYCGNDGYDKLIGVDGEHISIEPHEAVKHYETIEIVD